MKTVELTKEVIQDWLVNYLANILEVNADEIDVHKSFNSFGLDSVTVVGLSGDLSSWLGNELDPTITYDYPNVDKLAQYLSENK